MENIEDELERLEFQRIESLREYLLKIDTEKNLERLKSLSNRIEELRKIIY